MNIINKIRKIKKNLKGAVKKSDDYWTKMDVATLNKQVEEFKKKLAD